MKVHSARSAVSAAFPSVAGVGSHVDTAQIRVLERGYTGTQGWKRIMDVALSIVALILLLPLLLIAAFAVKLTSRGPVFFSQERIGLDRRVGDRRLVRGVERRADRRDSDRRVVVNFGRPFTMFKFRTMVNNAEKGRPEFARRSDPRITSVGRLLRKTRIDEIPQFVNVLRGEMSIVGPRPERAYFIGEVQKEIPNFQLRNRTKPGITGLAQVRLGYQDSIDGLGRKLEHDLEYIHHQGPATDLQILLRTVRVVFTGKGAH